MFANITRSTAVEALLDAHSTWIDPNVILAPTHASASAADPNALTDFLDEPGLRHNPAKPRGVDTTVWHIAVGAVADIDELDDDECAAIVRDIADAAGFTYADGAPTTRWVAVRSDQDRALHVIASNVGFTDVPVRVNPDHVNKVCRDIATRIFDQDRARFTFPDEDPHPRVVLVRDNEALGVSHAWGGDDLAQRLLARAGFRRANVHGRHVWRTPYGADLAHRARIATSARDMLSTVGYTEDIQATLLAGPRTDHNIGHAERRIDVLARLLNYCHTAADVADVTTEVAGALESVVTFSRHLRAWAAENLGDDGYGAELARAAELVDQASTVINRDPTQASTRSAGPSTTQAATARTTSPAASSISPTASARREPTEPPSRRTR